MARRGFVGPRNFTPLGGYQQKLGQRNYSFSTQIDNWVRETEVRMLSVVQQSLDALIKDMQIPLAKGGKMHVKTGFLRTSGIGAIGSMPRGPGRGDPNGRYNWEPGALAAVLAKLKLGDNFYWGWTANYALYREAYDGFMEASLMKWQQFVDKSVAELQRRIDSKRGR